MPATSARRLALALALACTGLLASGPGAVLAAGPEGLALQREAAALGSDLQRLQLAQQELNAAQAAQFDRRISALEQELRGLTGRLEDLDFRIRQLQQRQDRFESETKARLLLLEQGQGVADEQAPTATYTPPDGSGETVVGQAPQPQAAQPLQGGQQGTQSAGPGPLQPRTLGTVSEDALAGVQRGGAAVQAPVPRGQETGQATAPQQQAAAPADLPQNDPDAAYRQAFDQLRAMNYPAAESSFAQYLQLYPDSALAGNAKYWLGETHYVRGDYETAAVIFAEGYQDYPDSGKAPDNLLKLGMSLANLGATQDSCATFGELQRRYPDAAPTILQRARREASRLGC